MRCVSSNRINMANLEMFLIVTHLAQRVRQRLVIPSRPCFDLQLTWRAPNNQPVGLEADMGLLFSAKPFQLIFSPRDN